jgi:hypothetical protein
MKARASDGVTADVAVEEINRWLAEHDRQVAEKAWGQGAAANIVSTVMNGPSRGIPRNLYRQGEGSGNGASQSPVESSNLLNGEEQ